MNNVNILQIGLDTQKYKDVMSLLLCLDIKSSFIISIIFCSNLDVGSVLKHRKVTHFGFEFLYGSNNIDRSKPLQQKIPELCRPLIEKMKAEGIMSWDPDQLTVNEYSPGQGM